MPRITRIGDDFIELDSGETYRVLSSHLGRISYWRVGETIHTRSKAQTLIASQTETHQKPYQNRIAAPKIRKPPNV